MCLIKLLASIACLSLLLVTNAIGQTLYCPTTSQYVNPGDAMAVVSARCGQPTIVRTRFEPKKETVDVEQWVYHIGTIRTLTSGPPSLMFTIEKNRVIEIRLGGNSIGSTSLCNSTQSVKVGDLAETVKLICGSSYVENKETIEIVVGQKKITTWIYNYGPYQPQTKLEFEKGVLTSIQTGQFK